MRSDRLHFSASSQQSFHFNRPLPFNLPLSFLFIVFAVLMFAASGCTNDPEQPDGQTPEVKTSPTYPAYAGRWAVTHIDGEAVSASYRYLFYPEHVVLESDASPIIYQIERTGDNVTLVHASNDNAVSVPKVKLGATNIIVQTQDTLHITTPTSRITLVKLSAITVGSSQDTSFNWVAENWKVITTSEAQGSIIPDQFILAGGQFTYTFVPDYLYGQGYHIKGSITASSAGYVVTGYYQVVYNSLPPSPTITTTTVTYPLDEVTVLQTGNLIQITFKNNAPFTGGTQPSLPVSFLAFKS